jgi:hypothetical protein
MCRFFFFVQKFIFINKILFSFHLHFPFIFYSFYILTVNQDKTVDIATRIRAGKWKIPVYIPCVEKKHFLFFQRLGTFSGPTASPFEWQSLRKSNSCLLYKKSWTNICNNITCHLFYLATQNDFKFFFRAIILKFCAVAGRPSCKNTQMYIT